MHGPSSLSNEFRSNTISIESLRNYNIIENGIDKGIHIRRKADKILEFLMKTDPRKDKGNNFVHGFIGSHKRLPQHSMIRSGKSESEISFSDPTEDMENQSLLYTSLYEEEQTKEVSRGNHQALFRQAISLSSDSNFISDDSDYFHADKLGKKSDSSSPVPCKKFSSPACFRDISNLNRQLGNNANKRDNEIITDVKDGISSIDQSQVTRTEQRPTRKSLDHFMSGKDSSGVDSKTLSEQQNKKLHSRATNELISERKQLAHQADSSKSLIPPLLAPPPKPGVRTRFKSRAQKENSTYFCSTFS